MMKAIFLTTCLLFMTIMPIYLFPQQPATNNNDRQGLNNDEKYWQRYLEECETLSAESRTLYELLSHKERAEINANFHKDYFNPLFEKTKFAIQRITQTEDLRSAFESLTLHGHYPLHDQQGQPLYPKERTQYLYEKLNFASLGDGLSGMDILKVTSLMIVSDHRKEIVQGTSFGDVKNQKITIQNWIDNSDGIRVGMVPVDSYRNVLQFEYPILAGTPLSPPLCPTNLFYSANTVPGTTYDDSWTIMAIWSYKDNRSRNLLFEMVTRSDDKSDPLADWAVYYLPLLLNSDKLLPGLKTLFKEEIASAQQDLPDLSKKLLNDKGEARDPSMSSLKYNDVVLTGKKLTNHIFFRIGRLQTLIKSLEFNEKIPIEERERFDAFRRELAISWSLSCKTARPGPRIGARLNKGDEHFEIYLVEYPLPSSGSRIIQWEDEGNASSYPPTSPNPQKHKAFYERELANPRPIYTERQVEYIRGKVKEMERLYK